MNDRRRRIRFLQAAVGGVLMREWDPIGVAGDPAAQDEYDWYVPHACALLMGNAGKAQLESYLWWAETDRMGLNGDRTRVEGAADALLRIPLGDLAVPPSG